MREALCAKLLLWLYVDYTPTGEMVGLVSNGVVVTLKAPLEAPETNCSQNVLRLEQVCMQI